MASRTLQIKLMVECSVNGSIMAVSASGSKIMSDSLID